MKRLKDDENQWHKLFTPLGKHSIMEYLLFIIALVIAYPVFMIFAYVLSKMISPKDDAFEEFEAKQKMAKQNQRDRSIAHA